MTARRPVRETGARESGARESGSADPRPGNQHNDHVTDNPPGDTLLGPVLGARKIHALLAEGEKARAVNLLTSLLQLFPDDRDLLGLNSFLGLPPLYSRATRGGTPGEGLSGRPSRSAPTSISRDAIPDPFRMILFYLREDEPEAALYLRSHEEAYPGDERLWLARMVLSLQLGDLPEYWEACVRGEAALWRDRDYLECRLEAALTTGIEDVEELAARILADTSPGADPGTASENASGAPETDLLVRIALIRHRLVSGPARQQESGAQSAGALAGALLEEFQGTPGEPLALGLKALTQQAIGEHGLAEQSFGMLGLHGNDSRALTAACRVLYHLGRSEFDAAARWMSQASEPPASWDMRRYRDRLLNSAAAGVGSLMPVAPPPYAQLMLDKPRREAIRQAAADLHRTGLKPSALLCLGDDLGADLTALAGLFPGVPALLPGAGDARAAYLSRFLSRPVHDFPADRYGMAARLTGLMAQYQGPPGGPPGAAGPVLVLCCPAGNPWRSRLGLRLREWEQAWRAYKEEIAQKAAGAGPDSDRLTAPAPIYLPDSIFLSFEPFRSGAIAPGTVQAGHLLPWLLATDPIPAAVPDMARGVAPVGSGPGGAGPGRESCYEMPDIPLRLHLPFTVEIGYPVLTIHVRYAARWVPAGAELLPLHPNARDRVERLLLGGRSPDLLARGGSWSMIARDDDLYLSPAGAEQSLLPPAMPVTGPTH